VLSGPSGSGKTTICKELAKDPRVRFSVSATTRAIRPGERDGREYWFLTEAEFEGRVQAGAFLEHVRYNGNRYGTLLSELTSGESRGETVLLEIEVQGTQKLREQKVAAVYVFIMPPSVEVLRERLRGRGTEQPEDVERRLQIALNEMGQRHLYDHVVVNDDLGRAVAETRACVGLLQEPRAGAR
jgi:guanylate kinase